MTSLSGTKERSVSSRSRKYGVGYSSEWAGHTSPLSSVLCVRYKVNSIIHSVTRGSSHRQFNQRFISQASMNAQLHYRPASAAVDRLLCEAPTAHIAGDTSLPFIFTARTPTHINYGSLRTEHTHLCLCQPPPIINRIIPTMSSATSHCALVGGYSSLILPPPQPTPCLHHISEPVLSGWIYPAAKYIILQILVAYLLFPSGCLWSQIFTSLYLARLYSSTKGSILDLCIHFSRIPP